LAAALALPAAVGIDGARVLEELTVGMAGLWWLDEGREEDSAEDKKDEQLDEDDSSEESVKSEETGVGGRVVCWASGDRSRISGVGSDAVSADEEGDGDDEVAEALLASAYGEGVVLPAAAAETVRVKGDCGGGGSTYASRPSVISDRARVACCGSASRFSWRSTVVDGADAGGGDAAASAAGGAADAA
jgi:hypothetical protein